MMAMLQMSVLEALDEVRRQQEMVRNILDRLVRRINREEVKLLLDYDQCDVEELGQ